MGPGGASYFEFAMRKPPASFDSVDVIVRGPFIHIQARLMSSQDRFTAFFSAEWNLQGPFMFQQSILNAPNPVLTVSPLGTIGLPLGSHDTEQLKRIASSSSGAEANARNSVWEVDATKVSRSRLDVFVFHTTAGHVWEPDLERYFHLKVRQRGVRDFRRQ